MIYLFKNYPKKLSPLLSNLSLEPILNQLYGVCTFHYPFQITLILFSVRGCKNPRRHFAMAIKLNTLNRDMFGYLEGALLHFTLLALEFCGSCWVFENF
jgi:branched-subunit amino acid permease